MARKYRQGMESGDADTNQRDTNPNISRRDWLKLGVVGGVLVAGALAGRKYIEYNPQAIEKWCNEIMRRNKDPDAVENIHERIIRYEKELEELVEDAQPIGTFEGLNKLRENLRGNYKLVNDIYCPSGHNWEPIGNLENHFTGTFNGQSYTIHGLRAEWPERDCVGMFGYLKEENNHIPAICNILLKNVFVKGKRYVGKIVGYNNEGFIQNCDIQGEVIGIDYVGGIAGVNFSGVLSKCLNKGKITGKEVIGGVAGWNHLHGYIDDCSQNSEIYGENIIGTLIGWNYSNTRFSGRITNSNGTIGYDEWNK